MSCYQHARHAGNFADVRKHLVLWTLLDALRENTQPFVALDLYAGVGRYDLTGEGSSATGDWQQGIGRLWEARSEMAADPLLLGYLGAVAAKQPDPARLRYYPGSPELIRASLRERDALIASEPRAAARAGLRATLNRDARCRVHSYDALTAVHALAPPPLERGLALLDPPYESQGEYAEVARVARILRARWRTAIVAIWYPVVPGRPDQSLRAELTSALEVPWLVSELHIRPEAGGGRGMAGSGVLLLRPPEPLGRRLSAVLGRVHAVLDPECHGGVYGEQGP